VFVSSRARWAKVIVTPDDNSNNVLTRGKPQISKACTLFGGQIPPTAIEGAKLTWKKAQKKSKKKHNFWNDEKNHTIF